MIFKKTYWILFIACLCSVDKSYSEKVPTTIFPFTVQNEINRYYLKLLSFSAQAPIKNTPHMLGWWQVGGAFFHPVGDGWMHGVWDDTERYVWDKIVRVTLGIGHRTHVTKEYSKGIYLYFDQEWGSNDTPRSIVNVGTEWFYPFWQMNLNGYVLFPWKKVHRPFYDEDEEWQDYYHDTQKKWEASDAKTLEDRLKIELKISTAVKKDAVFSMGPYYREMSNRNRLCKHIVGMYFECQKSIDSRFALRVKYTYDTHDSGHVIVGLQHNIDVMSGHPKIQETPFFKRELSPVRFLNSNIDDESEND